MVANNVAENVAAGTNVGITALASDADGSFSTQVFSINLSDVDEFDVGPVSDRNGSANLVAENAPNGTGAVGCDVEAVIGGFDEVLISARLGPINLEELAAQLDVAAFRPAADPCRARPR